MLYYAKTNHFLQKYNRLNFKNVDEVPRNVLEMLIAYPWPGNVRELENCVQKAVVLAPGSVFLDELVPPTIRSWSAALPPERRGGHATPTESVEEVLNRALARWAETRGPDVNRLYTVAERTLINWALERERGVKLRAAKALGINRVTLDRKLVEHQITVKRGQGVVTPDDDEDDAA